MSISDNPGIFLSTRQTGQLTGTTLDLFLKQWRILYRKAIKSRLRVSGFNLHYLAWLQKKALCIVYRICVGEIYAFSSAVTNRVSERGFLTPPVKLEINCECKK